MKTIVFKPSFARKYPDPLNSGTNGEKVNIHHHLLIIKVKDLPDDIPTDPNPRDQNINKAVYKDVAKSLTDSEDLTFHLKNKGITIIASKTRFNEDDSSYLVDFQSGNGIVDGGHTYKIILANKKSCPDEQYVKVEVITGIPDHLIDDIAQGLNTSVQVQRMSLANLDNKFDWMKDALKNEPYVDRIAYKENEDGAFTIREIVSFLTMFNIDQYPNGSNTHPKIAYTSKEECLKRYLADEDQLSFKKLKPILKDILQLYDLINFESRDLYNTEYSGRAGGLAFYEYRAKLHDFIFINESAEYKLYDGALYPILGAFRYLVEFNPKTGMYAWKCGSFKNVKKLFEKTAANMILATKNTSDSRGRNPNAIGKDESHWDNLYKTVALAYLETK